MFPRTARLATRFQRFFIQLSLDTDARAAARQRMHLLPPTRPKPQARPVGRRDPTGRFVYEFASFGESVTLARLLGGRAVPDTEKAQKVCVLLRYPTAGDLGWQDTVACPGQTT